MIVNPGDRYGRLVVVSRQASGPNWASRWRVICDCGNERVVNQANLRQGRTNSCGCLNAEIVGNRKRRHGRTETAEYVVWGTIRRRCYLETHPDYPNYGGRGITVCQRWLELFENFLADMGERPSRKHSINRLDNDGPYAPGNCNWATALEQAHNKRNNVRLILSGKPVVLAEALRELQVSDGAYRHLKNRDFLTAQEAIDRLANRARRIALEGVPAAGNA